MWEALLSSEAFSGNSEQEPFVVIFLGPPGAGKGTHALPLSQELKIPHISTGALFREQIRNQTPLGKRAKASIDEGKLVPDSFVLEMLLERMEKPDCAKGFILDGFPRTVPQARALEGRLVKKPIAINLEVADSLLLERICGRIACKECGCPYHKKYAPPKREPHCDLCQGSLYQRDDDREEVLRKRLEVYRNQTLPLIDYYLERGILFPIDGQKSREGVFQQILEALSSLLLTT